MHMKGFVNRHGVDEVVIRERDNKNKVHQSERNAEEEYCVHLASAPPTDPPSPRLLPPTRDSCCAKKQPTTCFARPCRHFLNERVSLSRNVAGQAKKGRRHSSQGGSKELQGKELEERQNKCSTAGNFNG